MSLDSQQPAHWDVLEEHLHADCVVYQIVRRRYRHSRDGREGDFFVMQGHDWVQALPLTADQELVMVRQYRFGSQKLLWELPGGCLDPQEPIIEGALRELSEETGFTGNNAQEIGMCYPNPALQSNRSYFVLVHDCMQTEALNWDEHEELEVKCFPLDTVFSMVDSGEICHAITLNALFALKRFLEK